MNSLITRLSPMQRMDMIERGLNPINVDHIKKYISSKGEATGSAQENIKRIQGIMGDRVGVSLGHANDKDVDPNVGSEYNPMSRQTRGDDVESIRASMMAEMDDYSAPSGTVSPGKLLNLRNNNRLNESEDFDDEQSQSTPSSKEDKKKAIKLGEALATKYFNAFILSLKNPSPQANANVFKELKNMLARGQKLRGTDLVPYFNKGIDNITSAMYKQIKG